MSKAHSLNPIAKDRPKEKANNLRSWLFLFLKTPSCSMQPAPYPLSHALHTVYFHMEVYRMARGIGYNQQKVLLLLGGGLALGLTRSPKQYFRLVQGMKKEWKDISERQMRDAIRALYRSKMISAEEHPDGTVTIMLNETGKKVALRYDLDAMSIGTPEKWDGKWRMVLFDIPNNKNKARSALRFHLQELGFFIYQRSVFVHPYSCKKLIDFLTEYYGIREYVRYVVVESLDNELHLKLHFNLK